MRNVLVTTIKGISILTVNYYHYFFVQQGYAHKNVLTNKWAKWFNNRVPQPSLLNPKKDFPIAIISSINSTELSLGIYRPERADNAVIIS